MSPDDETRRRTTMLPVAATGIASAGLCAVVGHHPWAHASGVRTGASSTLTLAMEAGRVPGCTALSLVLLACWGVLLVTRGWVRRVVAVLGLLSSLGVVLAAVTGWRSVVGDVRDSYAGFGVTDLVITHSLWSFLAVPLVLVAVVAAAAAVGLVPTWPEMGRRYDAPVVAAAPAAVGEDQDDIKVWRALNEGNDPTV